MTVNSDFGWERNDSLRDVDTMKTTKKFIPYLKPCIFRKGWLAMMADLWYNKTLRATLAF